MLERGVTVSHETVARWCLKFGQAYMDEVFTKVNGEQKYLWRAVDADGTVLDILVQNWRNPAAARRFLRSLLKKTCSVPRVIVTDKLSFYGAHRQVMPLHGTPLPQGPQQPGREQLSARPDERTP